MTGFLNRTHGAAALKRAIVAQATVRAEQRKIARSTGSVSKMGDLAGPDVVDRVATMLAEQPADVVLAMQRRWPEVWRRVLASARDAGELPFGHLIAALERGLDAIDIERRC